MSSTSFDLEMNIRKLAKGESLIPAIERDFPELSGWWKDLANPEVQRCDVCKQLKLDNMAEQKHQSDGRWGGPEHHESWAALKASAVAGCQLCKLFYFVKRETDGQSGRTHDVSSMEQLYIYMIDYFLRIKAICWDEIQLEICTHKDWPQEGRGDEFDVRLVEDDPASEEAFARAHRWIEYCTANHLNCVVNDDVPLPTRVLDVHSNSVEPVSLFISNGQRSRYTALSHCWGNSSRVNDRIIRTCTTETLEELKNGISISRLPKTFQDAITVTRNFGIRYLWIDSLCIKQDSREDWSCESAKMSEVYGNSFLTILASTAQNSEQGFLGHRDPQRYIKTKFLPHPQFPELWTWVRWPGLSQGVRAERKIRHRAWAFQEYLLPSRVLEYAPEEMEWHCNNGMFEESESKLDRYTTHDSYKELMWILSLPEVGQPRINDQVPIHPDFADSRDMMSIYNRWYGLLEGYTARKLTFETDRLPAISGIARKIQEISGDSYIAGLWKGDLGAGLCWRIRGIGDVRHSSTYRAPSWSWASLEGRITHSIPEDHKLAVNLLESKIVADENNPLGEVFSSSILISGLLRKLQISQGTVSINPIEYDEVVKKWTTKLRSNGGQNSRGKAYLYALKDQQHFTDPQGTGICCIYFDLEVPTNVEEVILLQLLAEGFDPLPERENEFKPYGIVLERVAADEDIYRRIGAYSIMDADAEARFITTGMEHAGLGGWTESVITII